LATYSCGRFAIELEEIVIKKMYDRATLKQNTKKFLQKNTIEFTKKKMIGKIIPI